MYKQGSLEKIRSASPDSVPGEFDDLLKEIEKEAVPERLLELARQLQTALVAQRCRQESKESSSAGE